GGLCIACRKSAHKTRKLRLRKISREMDAGDSRGGEKLRETALSGCGSEGNTIEKNLLAGSAEKEATFTALRGGSAQFLPRSFKLGSSPHVAEFIQPCKLQQNIQTAYKLPRSCSRITIHIWGGDCPYLVLAIYNIIASYGSRQGFRRRLYTSD